MADQLAAGAFTPSVDAWLTGWDERFTAALAARGWLGMTVPVEYGGHGRSFLERFVVTEELLAAGAPVAAHWIADRQSAPLILRYGAGDYNCLHQDLYGALHFPFQVAILLSRPDEDFSGGEFVMTEQRPRMQSRPDVVPLRQGDAVVAEGPRDFLDRNRHDVGPLLGERW